MHFTLISNILIFTSFVSIIVMVILWRRRNVSGAKSLSFLMLAMFIWGFGEGMEMASASMQAKIFWAKIEYFGVVSGPVFFLIFTLQYLQQKNVNPFISSDQKKQLKNQYRFFPYLWFIPSITLLLTWTNEWHNLIWTGYHFITTGNYEIMLFDRGWWFWVNVIYTYSLLSISMIILVIAAFRFRKIFKRQALAVLLGVPIPFLANISYILMPIQLKGVDFTPASFVVTGIILTWGIYHYYLFDLTPFARETLMEFLPEAIIVLDNQNRIIDMNSAVNKLLGKSRNLRVGDSADGFLNEWISPELRTAMDVQTEICVEFSPDDVNDRNNTGKTKRFFSLCVTSFEHQGDVSGRVLIFTDISDRIANEDLLFETNEKLNAQLVEIHILKDQIEELAVRDALTGLYNRRFLDETLLREFARANREHYTISIAMIDVDNFKNYNDSHGHQAGDKILALLANHLVNNLREGDVVCRYGGEEFVVLLPFANSEIAANRINDLRVSFQHIQQNVNGNSPVTFSAGVASFPQHGPDFKVVLEAADRAMYRAKQSGRNRVAIVDLVLV